MNMVNMIKFQLKLIWKAKEMFMMFFIYPIVLTGIIGYLTQSAFSGGLSSYEYYSVGMMIFIFTSSGLISSFNFLDNHKKSGNLRTMYTPIRNLGIYLSQIISGTIYSSVAIAFTMITFSLLFGVNYNGNGILIYISFLILSFMSNALGMFLCTVIKNIGVINIVFNIVESVLCVLGGAFFSLEALGGVPAMLSKISPVKWLMDGLLNSMYDDNNTILFVTIGITIIISIVLLGLTSKTFKIEKYL
ncbi:ABC transporter permease [Clostridium paraputrificum]|uniref:ABC transporter permease n=1 Tax=Clostridium paraputrificum TaxID=29363 RepID=UPI003D359042